MMYSQTKKMKVMTSACLILLAAWLSVAVFNPSVLFAQQSTPTPSAERMAGAERVDERGVPQVWVPPGIFIAGSTQEQVDTAYQTCLDIWEGMCLEQEYIAELYQHDITLTYGFWIDQYEVSNTAFQEFVADGGYTQRDYWSEDGWRWKGDQTGPYDAGCLRELLEPDMPRSCITWYEADAYARWRGGSLPTEAEWEYAARGADGRLYPWGDTFDGSQLSYCDTTCPNRWRDVSFSDGYARTAPVGSYPDAKSWVGAYDLAGNVWEWTFDWYDAAYYHVGSVTDPASPVRGIEKVLRGGSWNMPFIFARTAYRDGVLPDSWSSIIGFRLVSHERLSSEETPSPDQP